MSFFSNNPYLLALISGFLFAIIANTNEIKIIIKNNKQRTKEERDRINCGLIRTTIFELLIIMPTSVTLFWIAIFSFSKPRLLDINADISIWAALSGIASYGFPFAITKKLISHLAIQTIRSATFVIDSKYQDPQSLSIDEEANSEDDINV